MQAREFMEQVQKAEKELHIIGAKRRQYEDLMMAIGMKVKTVVISKSGNTSKTETAAIGLLEMTEQLADKEREYTALVKRAEELIGKLKQDNFQKVLTYKYLCNMSWKSIRDEMGYKDEKSVYRCHGYALRELQKIM